MQGWPSPSGSARRRRLKYRRRAEPVSASVGTGSLAGGSSAVGMRGGKTTAEFTLRGLTGEQKVEALDENRSLEIRDGVFRDEFQPWDAHIYRIAPAPGR